MTGSYRFGAVPTAAIRDQRVSPATLRVLAELATYADPNGWCQVRQDTMGDNLHISRQAVSKHLRQLEALGYVQSKPQYRDDGGRRSNLYRVVLDTPEVAGVATLEVAASTTTEVAGVATTGVAGVATTEVAARTPLENTPREHQEQTEDHDFTAWWAIYPRKVDRKHALAKYRARRRAGVTAGQLLMAATNYAVACKRDRTAEKYIKHGATFLNGSWEEWLDRPAEPEPVNKYNRMAQRDAGMIR